MLNCAFCQFELPGTGRPVSLVGRAETCKKCGSRYTAAKSEPAARAAIAEAIEVEPTQVEMVSSVVEDGRLFVCCGWNPREGLKPDQVALIVRKSKATVQQHLREGRFPGAYQEKSERSGSDHYWSIPRLAVQAYLAAGRKKYTIRKGVQRGHPPKRKPTNRSTST